MCGTWLSCKWGQSSTWHLICYVNKTQLNLNKTCLANNRNYTEVNALTHVDTWVKTRYQTSHTSYYKAIILAIQHLSYVACQTDYWRRHTINLFIEINTNILKTMAPNENARAYGTLECQTKPRHYNTLFCIWFWGY